MSKFSLGLSLCLLNKAHRSLGSHYLPSVCESRAPHSDQGQPTRRFARLFGPAPRSNSSSSPFLVSLLRRQHPTTSHHAVGQPTDRANMTQDQPDEQQASRAPPDPMNLASIPDIMQRVFKKLEGQMTEEYRAILGVLERALVASDSSNATEKQSESETAAQTMDAITPSTDKTDPCVAAAAEIDRLCPNQTLGDSPGVEAFLTALWWMVFLTVRAVPFNHEGQHRLVRVVEALRLRAKSTVQVWGVGTLGIRAYFSSGIY